jgi:hypothetical protein
MPTYHLRSMHTLRAGTRTCYALITIFAIAGTAKSESFTGPGGPAGGWMQIKEAVYPEETSNSYSAYPRLGETLSSLTYGFFGGTFGGATRPVFGEATISATGRTLVATALSETSGGSFGGGVIGGTSASAFWADTISLVWRGEGTAPAAPSHVAMRFLLSGGFNMNPPNGYYDDPPISNSSSGKVYADHYAVASGLFNVRSLPGWHWDNVTADAFVTPGGVGGVGGYSGPPYGESSQATSFDGIVSLRNDATGSFNYYAGVEAKASYSSTYSRSTMTMQSLLLPNGFTPESEGWEVVFGSGMLSPNLAAVPEIDPNSFGSAFTLVLGALGLLERRARAKAA